jgi:hypothetical protein
MSLSSYLFIKLKVISRKVSAEIPAVTDTKHSGALRKDCLRYAMVLLQEIDQSIVWQFMHGIAVDTDHRFGRDERIDNSLFGSLRRRQEDRAHNVIRQHPGFDRMLARGGTGVGRRKRDENIAGTV